MDKDWIFKTDEYICDLRIVGVFVHNGRLLVQRDRDGSEYALPGGHVKIGETTVDGLVREYREETGADINVCKLLWTEECFWKWNGKQAHKDNCNVVLGWTPIDKLADMVIYPDFVKKMIYEMDGPPRHFITRA